MTVTKLMSSKRLGHTLSCRSSTLLGSPFCSSRSRHLKLRDALIYRPYVRDGCLLSITLEHLRTNIPPPSSTHQSVSGFGGGNMKAAGDVMTTSGVTAQSIADVYCKSVHEWDQNTQDSSNLQHTRNMRNKLWFSQKLLSATYIWLVTALALVLFRPCAAVHVE